MSRRLPADAPHAFGGIALDRSRSITFSVNGHRVHGFAGDTVLSALLAAGVDTYGVLSKTPMALSERFAPPAAGRSKDAAPIDRLPAADGLSLTTLGARAPALFDRRTLGHRIDGVAEPAWVAREPSETLSTDLLVVGGGVTGLAAAIGAAEAGRTVVLAERHPWLGGNARYFGPVGDEPSPETVSDDLIARLTSHPRITLLANTDIFALQGTTARGHRLVDGGGDVVAVSAKRVLLATGSRQRLPIFGGNRLPGVIGAIEAYHLAKRYGVAPGKSVVVATQSNYGYRLALRLHDAGIVVRRIVDPRVNPQSRFIDFAKASGLTLAGGQAPISAMPNRDELHLAFAVTGTTAPSLELDAEALIVSGPAYPELGLWMLAGGATRWSDGRLVAYGHVEHVALAGAANGHRSLAACLASGRATAAELFGASARVIDDHEIGAPYETPEAATSIGPITAGLPAFFDAGSSLIARADPLSKPLLTTHAQAPSLGDVAASVDLGLTSSSDAGAVAEERGAPGGDLVAAEWRPAAGAEGDGVPSWLAGRFGVTPAQVHLIVDGKRRFARGALVYTNTSLPDPARAVGVIIGDAWPDSAGGIALITSAVLKHHDRFIVETLDGPSPARIQN
jgi:sarcosine oxidase subunit alpha